MHRTPTLYPVPRPLGFTATITGEGRAVVTVDASRCPVTGAGHPDWRNADWPEDDEIDAEIGRQVGYPVRALVTDRGAGWHECLYDFSPRS